MGFVFLHLTMRGKYRGLCETKSHVVVVVNEGRTDFCTWAFPRLILSRIP